jgi:N-acyl-D-aspartate/D-glutamate deacylase
MIASDSYWENGTGHPRTTGTFSRVLGRYVRDARSLTLMDAIRKMTLMPAERLAPRVPAMKTKGRLRQGADADIAIFDAARVIDRSTYREPGCRQSACATSSSTASRSWPNDEARRRRGARPPGH